MIKHIDGVVLERLLLDVERAAHTGGWDGPPGLYVVYDQRIGAPTWHPFGTPIRCGPYVAAPCIPVEAIDEYPPRALYAMALGLRQDPSHAMAMATLFSPDILVGMALLCEGWTKAMDPGERRRLGDRRLADIPGSLENRIVTCADVAGEVRIVQRIRGHEPRVAETASQFAGCVPESLRYIVAAWAGAPLPAFPTPPSVPMGSS